MTTMKSKIYILLILGTILAGTLVTSSCSNDDNLSASIFDTTDYALDRSAYTFPLDTFCKVNFLEPYNMRFVYRMEDISSDMDKNLTPAAYDKSVDLAALTKYLWYDVYKKYGGEVFLKETSPRIIHVIGSKSYNTSQGTETLGVAEGGIKITLYNTNNLDVSDIDMMNEYFFKTMHHEFAHILDQTHTRPTDFNTISNGMYDAASWSETPDSVAAGRGFISPYASDAVTEDWAETIANYITRDSLSWKQLLSSASYDWEEVDCEDESAYNKLLSPGCDRDTIGYYHASQSGTDNKIYRRVCKRNADGTVALDANGQVQWTHTSGIDGTATILKKVEIAREYMQNTYEISIDSLRAEVQRRQFVTRPDGSFLLDANGQLVNRLTYPLDSDPSETLMDSLTYQIYRFKALQNN